MKKMAFFKKDWDKLVKVIDLWEESGMNILDDHVLNMEISKNPDWKHWDFRVEYSDPMTRKAWMDVVAWKSFLTQWEAKLHWEIFSQWFKLWVWYAKASERYKYEKTMELVKAFA